jgi:hypothetical protein
VSEDPRWPPPRLTVELSWGDRAVGVRVLRAVDDRTLVCSAAEVAHSWLLPPAACRLAVRWPDDRGLWTRPATVARVSSSALLTLEAAGEPQVEQRRRYYRAPVDVEVELLGGGGVASGHTRDLSEGGARVEVRGQPPSPRTPVTTRVHLGDLHLSIPATVVRSAVRGPRGEVGVAFGPVAEPEATALRRQVIDAQLDRRRKEPR